MLDRVQSVCDRVALFNKGSIVLVGTVPELGRQVLGGGFQSMWKRKDRALPSGQMQPLPSSPQAAGY
jgi:ABC-type multidrug transport system ATPase subunit